MASPAFGIAPARAARRPSAGSARLRRLKPMAVLALGGGLGLWATAFVLSHGIDPAAVSVGPWTTWPSVGTPGIDPYARAIHAQAGTIPLAAAEGVMFVAERDGTGARLEGACAYRVAGPVPPARLWTLTVETGAGTFVDTPAGRHGFTSAEVLRREGGQVVFDIAAGVRPGNWLPAPGTGPFRLVLRLYETPLGTTPAELGRARLPAVERLDCGARPPTR